MANRGLIERKKKMYVEAENVVRMGDKFAEYFWAAERVRLLSPTLFGICISDIEENKTRRWSWEIVKTFQMQIRFDCRNVQDNNFQTRKKKSKMSMEINEKVKRRLREIEKKRKTLGGKSSNPQSTVI